MWYTYLLAALMGLAGVNHFVKPKFYLAITPKYLPFPDEINYAAGVFQLLLCAGLMFAPARVWSAYLVLAMLIVFQVTIHAVHFFDPPKAMEGKWALLIFRFVIQFGLMYWAWMVAQKAISMGL